MKYYQEFVRTGQSFADRCGEPNEFHDAMGRIALSFSFMEEVTGKVILVLSDAQLEVGRIMTVELSFRQKLDVIGSLVHHHLTKITDSDTRASVQEELTEIIGLCQKAEDLRNTYFHSSYALDSTRSKTAAKRKHGLKTSVEPVDSALLLDVADFIHETAAELQALPLVLGLADSFTEDGYLITYTKGGNVVANYRWGQ